MFGVPTRRRGELTTAMQAMADNPLGSADYLDPARFAWERAMLFPGQPILAASSAALSIGHFVRCAVAAESMIVSRDAEGVAHAFANACLHRGFPLVEGTEVCRAELVCPYHGWRYGADGGLLASRGLDRPQQTLRLALRRLTCREGGGVILAAQRPLIAPAINDALSLFAALGVDRAVPVAEDRFVARCNWKIWVENFLECWHCATNHPELARTEGHVRQFEAEDHAAFTVDRRAMEDRAQRHGFVLPISRELEPDDDVFTFWEAVPLGGGRCSPTRDGARLGPALACEGLDGAFVFGSIGPFVHFSIAVDHAVLFSFVPHCIDETIVQTRWLAMPGADTDAINWLWSRTLVQDRTLTERQQRGITSRLYRGGHYLHHEQRTARFTAWWRRLTAST